MTNSKSLSSPNLHSLILGVGLKEKHTKLLKKSVSKIPSERPRSSVRLSSSWVVPQGLEYVESAFIFKQCFSSKLEDACS